MKSIIGICKLYLLTSIALLLLATAVAAQEGPGIVIAHPGQDVELLCTVTVTSGTQAAAWLMNKTVGPYRISAIRNGSLAGHTANQDSNNLIVKKIMTNDDRNGSEYRCVIVPAHGAITLANITGESYPTILYVAVTTTSSPSIIIISNGTMIKAFTTPIVTTTTSKTAVENSTTVSELVVDSTTTDLVARFTGTPSDSTRTTSKTADANNAGTNVVAATSSPSIMTNDTIIKSTTTPIVATTTTTTSKAAVDNTVDANNADDDSFIDGTLVFIILMIIIVLVFLCCCSSLMLFCVCCARKEWLYPNEKLCNEPRCSLVALVILGVLTFGISLLIWYIYLKCQSNEANKDKFCKITIVSIFVVGIYTCGVSVLLWWLCRGITGFGRTEKKYSFKDEPEIPLSSNEIKGSKMNSKDNKVPSVTNQLAEQHEDDNFTTTFHMPDDGQPTVSCVNDDYYCQDERPTHGYAVVDTINVIAYHEAVANAQQTAVQTQYIGQYALLNETANISKDHEVIGVSSAQPSSALHQNTGPYALPNETADKDQGVNAAGVTSRQQRNAQHQTTGLYALPSQTVNTNKDQGTDEGAAGVTSRQQGTAQHQISGAYALPTQTANINKDQGTDEWATGITNARQSFGNTGPYALPNETMDNNQGTGTGYADLDMLPSSGRIHTTVNDTYTPYAKIC